MPGVFVATVEFVDGAAVQSAALGLDPAAVFVEHPIQDRTDDEMRAIAGTVYDQIVTLVVD